MVKEQEKDKAGRKKTKRGRGGRKKKTKMTNKYPNDPDADGYEVHFVVFLSYAVCYTKNYFPLYL